MSGFFPISGVLVTSAVLFAPGPLPVAAAAPPAVNGTAQESAALAGQLRNLILQLLPTPLYEDAKKWNQQKKGPRGKMKNEGRWIKIRVTAQNPNEALLLTVDNMVKEKARKTFTINLTLPALVELERQTWRLGVRLYSGSTRARMRAKLAIQCELVTRVEMTKAWLPDMIIRLRVLSSAFGYDNVVVEHTAGVGGDAAKVLGDTMLGIVKEVKPSLERKLIDKANAAILKAGEAKEIRISLSDWLNGKSPSMPAKK